MLLFHWNCVQVPDHRLQFLSPQSETLSNPNLPPKINSKNRNTPINTTNSTNHAGAGCDPLDGVQKTHPRRPEAALHWKTRRYAGSDGNDNFGRYLTSYGTRTRPGKSRSAKIKVDRPRRFGWAWQLFLSEYLCVTIMWNFGVWRRLLTLEKVCKERGHVLKDSFIWTAENKISHRGWRSAEPSN